MIDLIAAKLTVYSLAILPTAAVRCDHDAAAGSR